MLTTIKNKIKNKLKNWLFQSDINDINKKINELSQKYKIALLSLENVQNAYRDMTDLLRDSQRIINSVIDVGTDIGFKTDNHSWAVICVQGKPEYVKFMPLEHKDTKEIMEFLKHFQYSNRIIDSPFGFKEYVDHYFIKG
jgi:hypothetical protein